MRGGRLVGQNGEFPFAGGFVGGELVADGVAERDLRLRREVVPEVGLKQKWAEAGYHHDCLHGRSGRYHLPVQTESGKNLEISGLEPGVAQRVCDR